MSPDARYDEVAEWYDATLSGDSPLASLPRETALRLLGAPAGRLLDVGCGGGSHTSAFAAAGWEPVGLDVSEAQLQLARKRGCDVVLGRAESLPFEDASFDAAVSLWTHTDVEDWAAAVCEIRRVVEAPGISPTGLRARVGATHLPLAQFLQAFLDAGFRFERVEEPGSRDDPIVIALRCR